MQCNDQADIPSTFIHEILFSTLVPTQFHASLTESDSYVCPIRPDIERTVVDEEIPIFALTTDHCAHYSFKNGNQWPRHFLQLLFSSLLLAFTHFVRSLPLTTRLMHGFGVHVSRQQLFVSLWGGNKPNYIVIQSVHTPSNRQLPLRVSDSAEAPNSSKFLFRYESLYTISLLYELLMLPQLTSRFLLDSICLTNTSWHQTQFTIGWWTMRNVAQFSGSEICYSLLWMGSLRNPPYATWAFSNALTLLPSDSQETVQFCTMRRTPRLWTWYTKHSQGYPAFLRDLADVPSYSAMFSCGCRIITGGSNTLKEYLDVSYTVRDS